MRPRRTARSRGLRWRRTGRSSREGVANTNVSLQSTSAYCFTGLGFSFKSAFVTPDYSTATDAGQTATFALGNPFGDCSSAQAEVATADNFTFTPTGFFIQFYN
jgi:hypothetical protein